MHHSAAAKSEDTLSAVEFLRSLKTPNQITLVGRNLGVFGVEMGAIAALSTAAKDNSIKAIAVDSVAAGFERRLARNCR